MHETALAHLHFDPPLPGLIGGTLLQGWLVAKPGHHFTDVRVVAGDRVFPGVFGLPRRDLAEFFKSNQPYLLAGFSVTLTLPAGRHPLVLEACTLAGTWQPIDALEREVSAAEAQPDPEARTPLDATATGEVLRILLRRLADKRLSPQEEAEAILRESPGRHHLQHPPRPFYGHLDQPQVWSYSLFGRTPVTGWVFHESLPIKRVFATVDLQAMQTLKYGRATAFLVARAPGSPHAAKCGYDGFLDLPAQLPRPVTVRVYAEMDDGSWHLGSVARFTTTDQEFAKQPFASFSPLTFWRAWRGITAAIRARGWLVPRGPGYRQAIRSVWREYAARAPRNKTRRPIPTRTGQTPGPDRVHLVTHNLSHEGAPLFLLEYARHLQAAGVPIDVTGAREGPLRRDFEAMGAAVRIVDAASLLAARDARALRRALSTLGTQVDLGGAGLVVANTLSSWWGVHLAHQAARPSLFYIHESTPPHSFFRNVLPVPALPVVEDSFRLASRVSFLTATSQRYFAGLSGQDNACLHPGWIDLAGIDRFLAEQARNELRARLGLAPGQKLVINIGTVCERKGQHVFARAVDLLARNAPGLAVSAEFLMVGGRDTPYDRNLAEFLAGLGRPNLRIVPETAEVYPYYAAADLFVCSSYEESFPRVVLEAMAFSLPIVSTNVHGIPEMARDGQEARLVPPGDTAALAAAMQDLLASPDTARTLALQARARVAAEYDSRILLPRHCALARTLLEGLT
ncbi:MAG TPA: glycosyltransferase family 4 protein [Lacunisphaera sp.]|nr:glycosyltransferase family 4 protein [Lacunisphaera sp.]